MVLNERHNEQNRQKWIFRANRERIDLSASVEETLEDSAVGEIAWSEDLDEQASLSQPVQGKSIFPPLLSLQSRPIPALNTDNATEKALINSDAIAPSGQERKAAAVTQNTNILKRFAQRFTSSFAALGGGQHEVIESQVQSPQEEVVQRTKLPEPSIVDENMQRSFAPMRESRSDERILPQRPTHSVDDEFQDKQGKQRLAGRTTRIHLETPPVVATARAYQPVVSETEKAHSDLPRESSLSSMNGPAMYIETADHAKKTQQVTDLGSERLSSTIPSLSQITQKNVVVNSTNASLPWVESLNGKADNIAHVMLSGSGVFEPGRGEAIVVNRHVMEASVVLVTLTANPGPVVVHYVTLRPRIGFTVHLTAPATMRASFNYVVLLGESL